jgi:tetratricopeptide (TPR) repeat protein
MRRRFWSLLAVLLLAAVASYQGGAVPLATRRAPDPDVDPTIPARLESLGTPGTLDSAAGRHGLAERHFAEGDYAEAAKIFGELVKGNPSDAALHTSLAGALAGLERYDEAIEQLDAASRLDPTSAPAYHNRGAIDELRGRSREAIKEYRAALRAQPDYAPSRQALARLGVASERVRPRSETERRAAVLAEQARDAAERGDFPGAMRLLREAERLAPRLALVYQYEANVAYLMDDRTAAIAALRKAIALEPDNALFRSNLRVLEAEAKR